MRDNMKPDQTQSQSIWCPPVVGCGMCRKPALLLPHRASSQRAALFFLKSQFQLTDEDMSPFISELKQTLVNEPAGACF